MAPDSSKNAGCAICGWDIQVPDHSAAQWLEPIGRWAHKECAEHWRRGALHKEPARKEWNKEANGEACILDFFSGPGKDPWNLSQRIRERGMETDDVDTEDPVLSRDLLDDEIFYGLMDKATSGFYAGGWLGPPCGPRCRSQHFETKWRHKSSAKG